MANKKITELNEASSITSADWLVMVDTGNDETKKIHPDLVGASVPIQDTAPQNPEENDLWIDTSEPEEMQEAIVNEYSESTNETYSCDYVNGLKTEILNGVFLYSNSGITTASITSNNGYGRCILISSSGIFSIQFNGTNTAPTIVDLAGTHSFTASVSGNVVSLSNLDNWDHYIFMGSNVIEKIE